MTVDLARRWRPVRSNKGLAGRTATSKDIVGWLEVKLNLILKETDVRNHGHGIAEAFANLLRHDDSVHLAIFPNRLLHPPHVSSQLTHRMIRTPRAFQLKHEESTRGVDRQDIAIGSTAVGSSMPSRPVGST